MAKLPASEEYGRPESLQAMQGITPKIGERIGVIVTFGSAIEYHLERYLWQASKLPHKDVQPKTDLMKITDLIKMLRAYSATVQSDEERSFLETWCAAAKLAFEVRNDLVHGLPIKMEDHVVFNRNSAWEGELRRKPFTDFWAEDSALDRMRAFMATLLRSIIELHVGSRKLSEIAVDAKAVRALREISRTLGELADRSYNPTAFEKY